MQGQHGGFCFPLLQPSLLPFLLNLWETIDNLISSIPPGNPYDLAEAWVE